MTLGQIRAYLEPRAKHCIIARDPFYAFLRGDLHRVRVVPHAERRKAHTFPVESILW